MLEHVLWAPRDQQGWVMAAETLLSSHNGVSWFEAGINPTPLQHGLGQGTGTVNYTPNCIYKVELKVD